MSTGNKRVTGGPQEDQGIGIQYGTSSLATTVANCTQRLAMDEQSKCISEKLNQRCVVADASGK